MLAECELICCSIENYGRTIAVCCAVCAVKLNRRFNCDSKLSACDRKLSCVGIIDDNGQFNCFTGKCMNFLDIPCDLTVKFRILNDFDLTGSEFNLFCDDISVCIGNLHIACPLNRINTCCCVSGNIINESEYKIAILGCIAYAENFSKCELVVLIYDALSINRTVGCNGFQSNRSLSFYIERCACYSEIAVALYLNFHCYFRTCFSCYLGDNPFNRTVGRSSLCCSYNRCLCCIGSLSCCYNGCLCCCFSRCVTFDSDLAGENITVVSNTAGYI